MALPFALVLLLGVGLARVAEAHSAISRAGVVLFIGAVVECSQYFDMPLFGRTFDPLDLLMYAAGATAALGFEKLAFRPGPERPDA